MRRLLAAALAGAALTAAAPAGAQVPGAPPLPILPTPPGGSPPPPRGNQPPPPPGGPAGSPGTGSVAVRVDPGHTGYLDDPGVVPPLRRRWVQALDGRATGPLVAEGKVFVLTWRGVGRSRASSFLYGLDAASGRRLWVRDVGAANDVAYDAGRVFVSGGGVGLAAYQAQDGRPLWARRDVEVAAPTAAGGSVYVQRRGEVLAIRGSDGGEVWKAPGPQSSGTVTVDLGRVFVAHACDGVRAFARSDGRALWHHRRGCTFGGATLAAVVGERLYADEGLVLDATSGRKVGDHPSSGTPLLAGGTGIAPIAGWRAWDLTSGARRWESPCEPRRDRGRGSSIRSSPLVVHRNLFRVTERGSLVACRLESGRVGWNTPVPFARDQSAGLGAGAGMVVLPTNGGVVAYESVYRPAPSGIAWAPKEQYVEYRTPFRYEGVVGTDLRVPGGQVTLEYDQHPYGGWRPFGTASLAGDGFFSGVVRTSRNTRFRVRGGRAVGPPVTVFTFPRLGLRPRRGRGQAFNTIIETVTLRFDPALRLAGRRLHLYLARADIDRLDRLGSATLRSRGRGRAVAVVRYPALRGLRPRDFVLPCIPGMWRLGLGPRDAVTRRCGARRLFVDV